MKKIALIAMVLTASPAAADLALTRIPVDPKIFAGRFIFQSDRGGAYTVKNTGKNSVIISVNAKSVGKVTPSTLSCFTLQQSDGMSATTAAGSSTIDIKPINSCP